MQLEARELTPAKPIRIPKVREPLRNRKVSARQSRFIDAYLDCGVAAHAALSAGYPESSAAQRGHEQLKSPIVVAEMNSRLEQRIKVAAPIGFKHLLDLAQNAESENVQLQASVALLDRAGYSVIRKVETTHLHDIRSDSELTEAAKALIQRLKELNLHGADAKPLIDVTPGATEVEADDAQSMGYEARNDEREAE